MENIINETGQQISEEVWHAEVLGQIYETNFAEMTQWIAEGALVPTDKVRRGNLRWLEAGRVPTLLPFFNAKEYGLEPPAVQFSITNAAEQPAENFEEAESFPSSNEPQNFHPGFSESENPAAHSDLLDNNAQNDQSPAGNNCVLHPDLEAKFSCETCGNGFCPQCPKSYGGTVKICPMCGAMCKKIGEKDVKKEKEILFSQAAGEGFGLNDIGKAFSHPFKFKTSLIFGGVMFMMFTLGQSAGSIGGIAMLFAALVCYLLWNMLSFGILANTIENFSKGKLHSNFMPDFDDFNLWDDVIHPFFLSIGAYLSAFGPFILISIICVYMLFSSMQQQMQKMQTQQAQASTPFLVDEQRALNQSSEVKKLLEEVEENAAEKRGLTETGINGENSAAAKNEEAEIEEINQMIQQSRKQELESIVGKTEETKREELKQLMTGVLQMGAPLLILAAAAFLWGVFYFPAACAVAGYTRSFFATINPSVGINTIKTFGADYFKILGVFIFLVILAGIIGVGLNILFLPFALPGMGNLPAIAVSSWFTFYFTIVFSCVVGLALFKNSEKFKFYRG